jgi:hypothetical protein
MRILSTRSCALRMAILLCLVAAIDLAAAFFTAKPQLWCAVIPVLIPLLTPATIFSLRAPSNI